MVRYDSHQQYHCGLSGTRATSSTTVACQVPEPPAVPLRFVRYQSRQQYHCGLLDTRAASSRLWPVRYHSHQQYRCGSSLRQQQSRDRRRQQPGSPSARRGRLPSLLYPTVYYRHCTQQQPNCSSTLSTKNIAKLENICNGIFYRELKFLLLRRLLDPHIDDYENIEEFCYLYLASLNLISSACLTLSGVFKNCI